MDPLVSFFIVAGLIIFLGFVGEIIFRKTNVPDIIWLMLFGIGIGAFFNVNASDISGGITALEQVFTTFALIFILFDGAIALNLEKLIRQMLSGTVLTITNFLISVVLVAFVGLFIGLPFILALLLGVILAGTTSAVVIPIVRRIEIKGDTRTLLTIESAFNDVLCIVAALTLIEIIEIGQFDLGVTTNALVTPFFMAIIAGVIAGFIWLQLMPKLEEYSKSYLITIAFLVILYGAIEYLGWSGAIACLTFGVILGNSKKILSFVKKYHPQEVLEQEEIFFYDQITFFVKAFFFVYLGILIDFSQYKLLLLGLGITVAIFLIRPIAVLLTVSRKHDFDEKEMALMEVLIPKGLAAAVLAQVPVQMGIPGTEIFTNVVLSVIFFSILFCSIFVFLVERGYYRGCSSIYRKIGGFITGALRKKQSGPF